MRKGFENGSAHLLFAVVSVLLGGLVMAFDEMLCNDAACLTSAICLHELVEMNDDAKCEVIRQNLGRYGAVF